jgi:protein TonB
VSTLVEWLSSPDPALRGKAAWSLQRARGGEAEVLPALRRLEEDEVREVRYAARWSIDHLEKTDWRQPRQGWEPPLLLARTSPMYPPAAFTNGIHGTVEIELLIGEDGEVAHMALIRSIPGLDAAALDCVRRWRFEPARHNGKPIATVADAPVTFSLM